MEIIPTKIQNLIRDGGSNVYHVRVRVGGKLVIRSLDTKVFTTAKLVLPDKLKEIRATAEVKPTGRLEAKATFEDAAKLYEEEVKGNPRLKPTAAYVRIRPLATLRRTWPGLFAMELRRITDASVKDYMANYERGKWPYLPPGARQKTRAGNSASTINKMII
jgi:hypothetical protein